MCPALLSEAESREPSAIVSALLPSWDIPRGAQLEGKRLKRAVSELVEELKEKFQPKIADLNEACQGAYSVKLPQVECVPVRKGLSRESLQRYRPGDLTSPASHACGSASLSRARSFSE